MNEILEPSDFMPTVDEIDALFVEYVSNNGSIESNIARRALCMENFQNFPPTVLNKQPFFVNWKLERISVKLYLAAVPPIWKMGNIHTVGPNEALIVSGKYILDGFHKNVNSTQHFAILSGILKTFLQIWDGSQGILKTISLFVLTWNIIYFKCMFKS